jgi:hypothetical protein
MILNELSTEEGEIKGQEDLAHYVRSFYTCLYTSEVNAPGTSEARRDCWDSTPSRVSLETNQELIKDLTLKEIQEAILAMPKGKAPGCDGIPSEFFQEFVDEICRAPKFLVDPLEGPSMRQCGSGWNLGHDPNF